MGGADKRTSGEKKKGRTAQWYCHADRTLAGPSLEICNALHERRVVGNAMEVFFDGGRKTPVVVDLCLQLIYCVLQTSYSKTFELFFVVVGCGQLDCLFGLWS